MTEAERQSILDYHRRHTKMRMFARYGLEIDDEGYYELCRLALNPVHRSDSGRRHQDIVVVDWEGVPIILAWHRRMAVVTTAMPQPRDTSDEGCRSCRGLRESNAALRENLATAKAKMRASRPCPWPQAEKLKRRIEELGNLVFRAEHRAGAWKRLALSKGATRAEVAFLGAHLEAATTLSEPKP